MTQPAVLELSQMSAFDEIRHYFAEVAPTPATGAIESETPLLGSGLLDSLGIIQLTTYLGEELGVEIADDDFTEENFATVGSLARFVERKRAA
jgi:acyl carrier protein